MSINVRKNQEDKKVSKHVDYDMNLEYAYKNIAKFNTSQETMHDKPGMKINIQEKGISDWYTCVMFSFQPPMSEPRHAIATPIALHQSYSKFKQEMLDAYGQYGTIARRAQMPVECDPF